MIFNLPAGQPIWSYYPEILMDNISQTAHDQHKALFTIQVTFLMHGCMQFINIPMYSTIDSVCPFLVRPHYL